MQRKSSGAAALTVEVEDPGMKADLLKPARRIMVHTLRACRYTTGMSLSCQIPVLIKVGMGSLLLVTVPVRYTGTGISIYRVRYPPCVHAQLHTHCMGLGHLPRPVLQLLWLLLFTLSKNTLQGG